MKLRYSTSNKSSLYATSSHLSLSAVVVAAVAGLMLTATDSPRAAGTTPIQPLAQNAPHYLQFTYPSAMSAPLPLPGTVNRPLFIAPSQTYPNGKGSGGVTQTGGTVWTSNNAFFQSLGTNGRSCFSCHQPADGMSLNTGTIQQLYAMTSGRDPLFAPVDGANCPSSVPRNETLGSLVGGLLGGGLFGGGQPSSRDAHSLLLNRGLFRIFLPVPKQTPDLSAFGGPPSRPAEFTISVVSDPNGCNTNPVYAQQVDPLTQEVQQMVSVYRRPRLSANLKFLTAPALTLGTGQLPNIDFVTGIPVLDRTNGTPISGNIMWDGREPTLESQARSATLTHAQATKPPTDAQVAQIVAFENSVFVAQSYHGQAGSLTPGYGSTVFGGPDQVSKSTVAFGNFALYNAWPTTTKAYASGADKARASIARGQALFNTRSFSLSNVAGVNNAALLGAANPVSTTCSSCHGNMPTGSEPFSAGQRDIGIGGQAKVFGGPAPSTDLPIFKVTCKQPFTTAFYGSEVLTNDPGLALITGRCADVGRKSVPQLRALSSRAPYFSDGSAATLNDTVRFYNKRFSMGLTDGDVEDLAHFLEAL